MAETAAEAVHSASGRRILDIPVRQRLTSEQAAARSLLVRRLRVALPILALALVAALLANTRKSANDDAFLNDFASLDATPKELQMASPRFAGVDDNGNPYEITTETALQAPGQHEIVQLKNPRAVTSSDSTKDIVTADKGIFEINSKVLTLEDGVTLEHYIGVDAYKLRTQKATVSIDGETVHAPATVEGEGPAGALRADSMRAYNNEGRVVFEGNVRMRLYPEKAKEVAKPAAKEAEGKPE